MTSAGLLDIFYDFCRNFLNKFLVVPIFLFKVSYLKLLKFFPLEYLMFAHVECPLVYVYMKVHKSGVFQTLKSGKNTLLM